MVDRDFIAEPLKDAHRKVWETIGLLTTARMEAERLGHVATVNRIERVQLIFAAIENPGDLIDAAIKTHMAETRRRSDG